MRLFMFAASLRKESFNKQLASLIAVKLEGFGVDVDHADFREFDMPLYDADLEASEGLPAGTQALANRISAADGTIIVSPEYNYGVPGPLKNAIDWLSRVKPFPTAGKPGFLASAAPGVVGGGRGLIALRPSLSFLGMWLSGDSFSLAQARQAFNEQGGLADGALDKLLDDMLDRFVKVAGSLKTD
jgi:chromate reductase